METLKELIKKLAVQNRLRHEKADAASVLGKLLAEHSDLRKDAEKLKKIVDEIVGEVNKIPADKLGSRNHTTEKKETYEHFLSLTDNPENVVMRFAPNPNGPATIGSARGIVVNSELVKKYSGTFILRFDDTDAKIKRPLLEAYKWYVEDCEWLDAKPDKVVTASDRIEKYYEHAEKLIQLGKAYVCFCEQEKFKKLKDAGKPCEHRETKKDENLKHWKEMLQGKYNEGDVVLRIKTDLKHRDPAIRDWVAFRILKVEHPCVGKKYPVWPMLDFESAIEDKLQNVTHIIRGKDLADSETRQRYIYDYLGWKYPKVVHWGRLAVEEFGKLSTSQLAKAIEEGKYTGWDDPRIPTLRALKRRGILPRTIRQFMIDLGLGENDVRVSMENLYAMNRKLLDPHANRYFFVENPVKMELKNCPGKTVRIPYHPSHRDRGYREYPLCMKNDSAEVYISRDDASNLKEGDEVRLIGLYNFKIKKIKEKEIIAEYVSGGKEVKRKLHWVQDFVDAEVLTPDGVLKGYCERECGKLLPGAIVQFERFGFVRLDRKEKGKLFFVFGHR